MNLKAEASSDRSKPETATDRLRRLRKSPDFAAVWTAHSEERMVEYGFDKLSIHRIVKSGAIRAGEPDLHGREQVHVSGTVDAEAVDIVVEPALSSDGSDVVRIVTVKPKKRRR